jgi:hypothetical protein
VTDPNGYPVSVYAFEDSSSNGHFVFNGVTEPAGQYFLVPEAQLSEVSFVAGAPGSVANLSVNVFDGTDWGNGATFQVSVAAATSFFSQNASSVPAQARFHSNDVHDPLGPDHHDGMALTNGHIADLHANAVFIH